MKRITDWWFAPGSAERLAAVRIVVGLFGLAWVAGRLWETYGVAKLPAQHFRPIGVVRLLDAPLPPTVVLVIAIATSIALGLFVLGAAYRVVAPIAALGVLWTLTYRNSWGMVFHTENLLVLHLLVLSVAPAADAFSIDHWRGRRPGDHAGYGWVLKLLLAITAVTYVLAGIAKLRIAGMDWLEGEQLRNQIAVDNLRKALLGDAIAPLGTVFLDHPAGFTVFSVMTIVLELTAPLMLVGRRIGAVWALGAWGFHLGVILLMNIWFPYPLLGLAYAPLIPFERPIGWIVHRAGMWRRSRR